MGMKKMIRTYSELIKLKTFKDRFEYLKAGRNLLEKKHSDLISYMNQIFYKSREWTSVRRAVIIRDNGCDLGVEGYEIHGKILIHHMNPINLSDIVHKTDELLNPDYLITTVLSTHNAIHYGDASLLPALPIERRANDTCPWKRN